MPWTGEQRQRGSKDNSSQSITSKKEEDMNANRIVFGFIAGVTSLSLSGWSLVSPAAAATIVVTTTEDSVDPPFSTGSVCGSGGTVTDLPKAGNTVSLREAVIAANNTPG